MKSEIFYLDDNNNIVDKELSTRSIVREYDENGNLVNEIFRKKQIENSSELTEEQLRIIEEFDEKYSSNFRKI